MSRSSSSISRSMSNVKVRRAGPEFSVQWWRGSYSTLWRHLLSLDAFAGTRRSLRPEDRRAGSSWVGDVCPRGLRPCLWKRRCPLRAVRCTRWSSVQMLYHGEALECPEDVGVQSCPPQLAQETEALIWARDSRGVCATGGWWGQKIHNHLLVFWGRVWGWGRSIHMAGLPRPVSPAGLCCWSSWKTMKGFFS